MRKLYKLGPMLLDPQSRVLTHDGAAVPVGARGVAVLAALVSRPNEYVEKSAILDTAWPGLVVEEANLAVQISAIRRALGRVPGGENWIETLPRRGYRFVGPVAEADGRSAPLVALDRKRTNLPELLTSFVGREREVAEIKQLLPCTRLLTLTGTGGIGKTRLAQQGAAEVLDAYRNGVWFVDLAPLVDPTLVPSALAQVLGLKESGSQPLGDLLCAHLRAKELLLVLDNCEHVLDACARLVEALCETTQVTIVATSREALHLSAEHVYPVAPLPLPDPKASAQSIARSDSVQLFVERARQHRPRFDLLPQERTRAVAEICVRLDGIPLALELAAARVAVLPVEQIARLLDQRFRLLTSGDPELPRHQTLRAMIDWSYELLDEAEKALLARLSVFAGSWTLAAAEAVCAGEPIGKDELVYVLIALIERSLVVAEADSERYRMLETIRQYAHEKLVQSEDGEKIGQKHRDYFLALVEGAEPKLISAEQVDWLRRLEEEHDNLRAALEWSLASTDVIRGLRLCGALQRFWMTRGHLSEGREWCARMLAAPGAADPTLARAKVLNGAGLLAYHQLDYRAARAQHEQALAIRREHGDRRGTAVSLNNLGIVALDEGDLVAAHALHEESLAIAREVGNRNGAARSLGNLSIVALEQRDYGAARALIEESLALLRELDDRDGIAINLHQLGEVASRQGDFETARRRFGECLRILRDLGHKTRIPHALDELAAAITALGRPLDGARLWSAAEQLREGIGAPAAREPRLAARVAGARAAAHDDAAFDRAWQEGRTLTIEQAIELAARRRKAERAT